MRILTVNCHGVPFITENKSRRMKLIAEQILEFKPDVALLQEVWLEKDAKILNSVMQGRYNAVEPWVKTRWYGWRDGGLMAFIRKEFTKPFYDGQFTLYVDSSPYWKFWEGDGFAKKGIQIFTLTMQSGHNFCFYNTHIQSQYDPKPHKQYQEIKERQIVQLRKEVLLFAETDLFQGSIIAGDWNTRRHERAFTFLTHGWKDLTGKVGSDQIDYIYYAAGESPVSYHNAFLFEDRDLTDHPFIVSDCEIIL